MNINSLYAELGMLIQERRKHYNFTQADLSAKLGMSRASLANIETGRQSILVHQLYDIADKLDLEIAIVPKNAATQPAKTYSFPIPKDFKGSQRRQIESILISMMPDYNEIEKEYGQKYKSEKRSKKAS